MRRKYWIHYYRSFANTYSLYWTDGEEMEKLLPDGAIQISRKQAIQKCQEERKRRKTVSPLSIYADVHIFPVDLTNEQLEQFGNRASNVHILDGYIVTFA